MSYIAYSYINRILYLYPLLYIKDKKKYTYRSYQRLRTRIFVAFVFRLWLRLSSALAARLSDWSEARLHFDNQHFRLMSSIFLGYYPLYTYFINLFMQKCLERVPKVTECCGCIKDLKLAAAIIAVLGIVSNIVF